MGTRQTRPIMMRIFIIILSQLNKHTAERRVGILGDDPGGLPSITVSGFWKHENSEAKPQASRRSGRREIPRPSSKIQRIPTPFSPTASRRFSSSGKEAPSRGCGTRSYHYLWRQNSKLTLMKWSASRCWTSGSSEPGSSLYRGSAVVCVNWPWLNGRSH